MIDPDGLQITTLSSNNIIKINNVPEFETEVYCLEDDKDFSKFVKDIERAVRTSFEYRNMIKYLRENMGMDKCAFLKNVSNQETFDIKIEIHHYPFTLFDIVEIVIRKRTYYNESLTVQMIAKEVTELHYKLMVGLISLSETVHELAHNGRIFIPVDRVLGRYNLFVEFYKPFCEPEQLEVLERIEKYTLKNSDILNTTILEQNNVLYEVKDNNYCLPEMNRINDNMIRQLELIKSNNYLLPDINSIKDQKSKKETICPIEFDYSLIKE